MRHRNVEVLEKLKVFSIISEVITITHPFLGYCLKKSIERNWFEHHSDYKIATVRTSNKAYHFFQRTVIYHIFAH